jgi:2-polyprenyl-3-methyl-5-hydroxy-6-metoxy-1,4-benzoquinol methylase
MPAWRNEAHEARSCPLCDRPRPPLLRRPDGLPLSYCPPCRLWFVARAIPEAALRRFYEAYWGAFRAAPRTASAARRFVDAAEAGAARDPRLQRLEALLGGLRGRRIFEVGCGLGGFLAAARARGADVVGQDISGDACEFARERIGVAVRHEGLESCPEAVGPVDAVVMLDVLEHLSQPKEALAIARRMLAPGGLLLLWTPNGGAAGDALDTARSWIGFRVDLDHLQYVSAETVAGLCGAHGWRVEHLETIGFPDLEGFGENAASNGGRLRRAAELCASRIPGARRFAGAFKAMGRDLEVFGCRDARRGTFHLFTILRKDGRPG